MSRQPVFTRAVSQSRDSVRRAFRMRGLFAKKRSPTMCTLTSCDLPIATEVAFLNLPKNGGKLSKVMFSRSYLDWMVDVRSCLIYAPLFGKPNISCAPFFIGLYLAISSMVIAFSACLIMCLYHVKRQLSRSTQ